MDKVFAYIESLLEWKLFPSMSKKSVLLVGAQEVWMIWLFVWKMLTWMCQHLSLFWSPIIQFYHCLLLCRKATNSGRVNNHDFTWLRVGRQFSLFKLVAQCPLSQSYSLLHITNRWTYKWGKGRRKKTAALGIQKFDPRVLGGVPFLKRILIPATAGEGTFFYLSPAHGWNLADSYCRVEAV